MERRADRSEARIAYLGPAGTFTEEALASDPELSALDRVPMASFEDVLAAACEPGTLGFVPIENSIEGSVNATLDSLVFDHDLLIQREVVLNVHLQLLALPGTELEAVEEVLTYPVAAAQCRRFLSQHLPSARLVPATSTAEAARCVSLSETPQAAIATAIAGDLYGLEVLARDIEDHRGNQTRFVAVAAGGIPPATGHDRTTIVCFQRFDRPGSLLAILEQFAARSINLTRLESRPTKGGLGQYCFVLDLDGHVEDAMVADCLRNLHVELEAVKFLGSYPAAGKEGPARRREAELAWADASRWVEGLQAQIRPGPRPLPRG